MREANRTYLPPWFEWSERPKPDTDPALTNSRLIRPHRECGQGYFHGRMNTQQFFRSVPIGIGRSYRAPSLLPELIGQKSNSSMIDVCGGPCVLLL